MSSLDLLHGKCERHGQIEFTGRLLCEVCENTVRIRKQTKTTLTHFSHQTTFTCQGLQVWNVCKRQHNKMSTTLMLAECPRAQRLPKCGLTRAMTFSQRALEQPTRAQELGAETRKRKNAAGGMRNGKVQVCLKNAVCACRWCLDSTRPRSQ